MRKREFSWRTLDGRRVTYDGIQLFAGYMQIAELVYEAMLSPDEEPPAFTGVLADHEDARDGERERLAEHVGWLRYWDVLLHQLYNPEPEELEV